MKLNTARRIKLQKIAIRLPALFIASAIWVLSSQSILPKPKGIFGFDKFQHVLVYASLAFTSGFWVSPDFRKCHPFIAMLFIFLFSSWYGITDEIHQYFVPGRDCSIWDWLADTLGAVIGAAGIMLVLPSGRNRRPGAMKKAHKQRLIS